MAVGSGIGLYGKRLSEEPQFQRQFLALRRLRLILWSLVVLLIAGGLLTWSVERDTKRQAYQQLKADILAKYDKNTVWMAPDWSIAAQDPNYELIAYGKELIANTNDYFGDNGIVRPHSINAQNCQNCHLDAGTKPFGNNYSGVVANYPKVRARSGTLETIPKRVNDCFQRSLNGQPLDTTSREMEAIVAYIQWLAMGVPKGEKPKGVGLAPLPYLDRPADPARGKIVFESKCVSCHGSDGQGLPMPGAFDRRYPPLWGEMSFNQAAGLFRLTRFASYVKANMPLGASYENPQLTDEEAWDVAAFVESKPRPENPFIKEDWPDISKKPIDHPFGPYVDSFPETQHKYGPFAPIADFYASKGK
ncbi:MAG: c-type cytochrome [Lewinellaceae bacterium]|nr:c-type cytochrome [Lewinellaceae bacterium]